MASHPHPAGSAVEAVAIEDLLIPSDTPGIELHLRHK